MVLGVLALYVAMILFGYSKADPGWSHAVQVEHVSNPGGTLSAPGCRICCSISSACRPGGG
jgi:S-DNA-T family DNA segregation ATPase FtsK/SpoIIIE